MQEEIYIQIDEEGNKFYYRDKAMTVFHRSGGPAIQCADGYKAWWVDGKLHRTDGHAIERANGTREWYVDGKLHRTIGPAIEHADGTKFWCVDGKLHRTDGPAIEYADGAKAWYANGRCLTEEQFDARYTKLELTLEDIASKFGVDVNNLKIIK